MTLMLNSFKKINREENKMSKCQVKQVLNL